MTETPPPLPYRNADDDRTKRRTAVGHFIAGAVLGAPVPAVAGFVSIFLLSTLRAERTWVASSLFVAAAAVGMWCLYRFLRWRRQMFWAGFFFGFTIACLIAGSCFARV